MSFAYLQRNTCNRCLAAATTTTTTTTTTTASSINQLANSSYCSLTSFHQHQSSFTVLGLLLYIKSRSCRAISSTIASSDTADVWRRPSTLSRAACRCSLLCRHSVRGKATIYMIRHDFLCYAVLRRDSGRRTRCCLKGGAVGLG
jgi:hypothetical protein